MTCSVSSIERTKPPAYLFRYQICQRARDKNQTSAPYHLRRARPTLPQIFSKPTNVAAARSVPPCASAPPVKGYLRPQTNTRNPFFIKILKKMGYCLFSMACMIAAFATLRAHMALAVDNSGYSGAGLRFSTFAPPSGPESGESERPEGSESRPDRSSALSASL